MGVMSNTNLRTLFRATTRTLLIIGFVVFNNYMGDAVTLRLDCIISVLPYVMHTRTSVRAGLWSSILWSNNSPYKKVDIGWRCAGTCQTGKMAQYCQRQHYSQCSILIL